MSATPAVRLSTLGGVSCATQAGDVQSVTLQPRRVALLVYLVLARPRGHHSRDQLLALFWPNHEEQRARNALNQAVHFLRRSLGAEVLVNGGDDQLRIDPELVWCDVIAFEAALAAGRTREALELYRGHFLEGFHITAAAAELDAWVDSERDRLRRLYAGALQSMARDSEAAGDFTAAVAWHRRLAALDPLSSRLALGLIRALAAVGDDEGALQQARVYEAMTRAELDAPPDRTITDFVSELRRRMETRTPNVAPIAATTSGESTSGNRGQTIELVGRANGISTSILTGRGKRRAIVAVSGVIGATLAFVPMASRKHAAATPRLDCVAVLPMENLSGDRALGHFAEAMTSATITELEKYDGPQVRPRSSVLAVNSSHKSLPEIGRALRCDGIVQQDLTINGSAAHVDAQILYAPADRHLWAESYEDDTSRLLVLQRRVTQAIARHVRVLAGQVPGTVRPSRRVDPDVFSLYKRGRDAFRGWNAPSVRQAVALFQQSIALDSTFAPSYAGLADAYNLIAGQGYGPVSYWDSARTLANRAFALDSTSSEAHATRAYILTNDADWTHAETEFKRAIELDPENALAHMWYATLLAILDRREEAITEIRRAADLDPQSQEIMVKRGNLQFLAGLTVRLGNPGKVETMADPNHPATRAERAITLARRGRCADAYQEHQTAQELAPDNTIMLVALVLVHRACNDSLRANALLAQVKRRPDAPLMAVYIAMAHVAAQEPDSAFAWLNRSRWGVQTYYILRANRNLIPLRADKRFADLLQRLHMQ